MVAMLHVHSTTAILNHQYASRMNIPTVSGDDVLAINTCIEKLQRWNAELAADFPILGQVAPLCRSAVLLLWCKQEYEGLMRTFEAIPFVKYCIDRALREAVILYEQGFRCFEIENVAAPYFVGAGCTPWEDILTLHVVARKIRRKFPQVALGIHILSADELEALPLAICHGALFVRSEATLFSGLRPEGPTKNDGNLARFMYVRNVLRALVEKRTLKGCLDSRRYPQVWSDMQKKHTVFNTELEDLHTWTNNIGFMKLEGVIITGVATGSDAAEEDLQLARQSVDSTIQWNEKTFGPREPLLNDGSVVVISLCGDTQPTTGAANHSVCEVPLVTGSGAAFDMYANYVDFVIVGTALKVGNFWENDVDPQRVRSLVEKNNKRYEFAAPRMVSLSPPTPPLMPVDMHKVSPVER